MKHQASPRFWRHYRELPESVRRLADKNFVLLKADPFHSSLHLKRIGRVWSVRVGAHYRALGLDIGFNRLVLDWLACRLRQALMIPTAEQIVGRERRLRYS